MKKILSFLLPIALVAGFTACNKENPDEGGNGGTTQTPGDIEEIVITVSETTTTSLTFTWSAVEEAGSLKYNLTAKGSTETIGENTGALQGTATTATCTGLTPNTEYTFTLKAYKAANGTGNPVAAGTKDTPTAALAKLGTPEQLEALTKCGITMISWNEVENAVSYTYTIKKGDEEYKTKTITDVYTSIYLVSGTYTLSVVANPEKDDTVNGSSDAATSEAFTIARTKKKTSKASVSVQDLGNYVEEDKDYATIPALCAEERYIDIYSDSTFILKSFLGGNANLVFSIDEYGNAFILNAYDEVGTYQYVSTGLGSPSPDAISIYPYQFTYEEEEYIYPCGTIDDQEYGSTLELYFYYGTTDCYAYIAWDVPAGSSDDDENEEGGTTPGEEGDN